MQKNIYDNLSMELPNTVEAMTEDEMRKYYQQIVPDFAGIDRASNSIMCVIRQGDKALKKDDVKTRIAEYETYYGRMCPGYQRGQMLMRKEKIFNIGVLSYKSNTPDSMRFNVVAVMNYCDVEVFINMSCDIDKAFDELPKFTKILQSVEVAE